VRLYLCIGWLVFFSPLVPAAACVHIYKAGCVVLYGEGLDEFHRNLVCNWAVGRNKTSKKSLLKDLDVPGRCWPRLISPPLLRLFLFSGWEKFLGNGRHLLTALARLECKGAGAIGGWLIWGVLA
jgi:hypothetical protein